MEGLHRAPNAGDVVGFVARRIRGGRFPGVKIRPRRFRQIPRSREKNGGEQRH
jgi:hypothetical protein